MKNIFLILIPVYLISCDPPAGKENLTLSQRIAGEWKNSALEIRMNTYKDTDSSRVFKVNDQNWEEKMRIRPIRTHFRTGGTYTSEHRNLRDSIIYQPAGTWIVIGDTIIMTDTFPQRGLSYKYHVNIKSGIMEFRGIEDCDGDGKNDDEYLGFYSRGK
jgi:hypothetical protein